MKKILLFTSLILIFLAFLPLIGNKLIKDSLDTQIERLRKNGIEVREDASDSNYFQSVIHYEFLLKDTSDLASYINGRSTNVISKEVARVLEGSVVGVDLEYFNIPYLNNVSIDIYPLFFSKMITDELKQQDESFYAYLSAFLKKKGILYHLEYNMLTEEFIGFIKDIKESYTLKNGIKISVELTQTTYKGKGDIRIPVQLNTNAKKIFVSFADATGSALMNIENFASVWSMDSSDVYRSNITFQSIQLQGKDPLQHETALNINNMDLNISSDVHGEKKAKLDMNFHASNAFFQSTYQKFQAKELHYDVLLLNLDMVSKRELESLFSKSNLSEPSLFAMKLKSGFADLLSKGADITIRDASMQNIELDGVHLGGFDARAEFHVKRDKNLPSRLNYPIMLMIGNVEFHLLARSSEKLFKKMMEIEPFLVFAQFYVKKENGNVILDIGYKRGRIKLNGKWLPWL